MLSQDSRAPVAPLLRDYLPADLHPLMARTGITRTIVVQAAETDFVAGVVGGLDMDDASFPDRLARYRQSPYFVGLRLMRQGLEDDAYILRPRVLKHLGLVARRISP